MVLEVVITALILGFAAYMIFKNIKNAKAGKCNGCSSGKDCANCSGSNIIINKK